VPSSRHFEVELIRQLGSLSAGERERALERLYESDMMRTSPDDDRRRRRRTSSLREPAHPGRRPGVAFQIAKALLGKSLPARMGGSRMSEAETPDDLAQIGWCRVLAALRTRPLEIRTLDAQAGFAGYLSQCVMSAFYDQIRKWPLPSVLSALKELKGELTGPRALWVQAMIDADRAGARWSNSNEVARRLGVETAIIERFVDEVVRPTIDRYFAQFTRAPRGGPAIVEIDLLIESIEERIPEIFKDAPKEASVARALLRMRDESLFKGKGTVDHERLMRALDEAGTPWISSRCVGKHSPGALPSLEWNKSALECDKCRQALQQTASRSRARIRHDEEALEAFNEMYRRLNEADVARRRGLRSDRDARAEGDEQEQHP